jgi:hypothetical protein
MTSPQGLRQSKLVIQHCSAASPFKLDSFNPKKPVPKHGRSTITASLLVDDSIYARRHESRPYPASPVPVVTQMHVNKKDFFAGGITQFIPTAIMLGVALLCCALVLAEALQDSRFNLGNFVAYAQPPSPTDYKNTCDAIARSISSSSQVFYPGELRVIGL